METEEVVPVGNGEIESHPQAQRSPAPLSLLDTDDDDYYEGGRDMNEEEDRIYWDQLLKSDGFDVPSFPGVSMFGQVHRMNINDKTNDIDYEWYSQLAVEEYNRRFQDANGELEFVKVLKAMAQPACGIKFYITFEAKDLADHEGKIKTYQAVVLMGIGDTTSVLSFRLKPPEDRLDASGNLVKEWFWKGHLF